MVNPWTLEEGEDDVVLYPIGEELRDHSVPSPLVRAFPHYGKVPKARTPHKEYRDAILNETKGNSAAAKRTRSRLLAMWAEDPLFWINSCLYAVEPRKQGDKVVPFNTWPHQDNTIAAILHYLGKRDIGINKSRGEGVSWLVLNSFLHAWFFKPLSYFGLVSMNKALADNGTLDSLMGKLEWQLRNIEDLYPWMMPKGFNWRNHRLSSDMSLTNPENGSVFTAFPCTANVATGTRKLAFLMDEVGKWNRPDDSHAMTSTQHVTDCRIIVSTPFGNEGAYYDAIHVPSSMLKVTMHWTHNPIRTRGLYRYDIDKNKLIILDKEYKFPKDYPFERDGKTRSPWYDRECRKPNANARTIAQDLDLNFEQSVALFFDEMSMTAAKRDVKPPMHTGNFDFSEYGAVAEWAPLENGRAKLWMPLVDGLPPRHRRYIMGVDISSGSGGEHSSNSVIQVLDRDTGEQVLEWADNNTHPPEFAQLCVAVCRWLSGEEQPFMVWEANGPGGQFRQEVQNLGYHHVYKRESLSATNRTNRKLMRTAKEMYGVYIKDKAELLEPVRVALKINDLSIRSEAVVGEMPEYRYINGKVEHYRAAGKDTDEGSKKNLHGDRITALGCAVFGFNEFRRPRKSLKKTQRTPREYPLGSQGWRLEQKKKQEREKRYIF